MVPTQALKNSLSVVILAGPSATGKSQIAYEFTLRHPQIEIINADSLLVYREMNIGTAKPSVSELAKVPHHLINILDPNEHFSAGDFVRKAEAALTEIHQRGQRALIVGGTGFYLKALLFGIWNAPTDPQLKADLQQRSSVELFQELQMQDGTAAQKIGIQDRYRLIRAIEIIRLTGKKLSTLQADQPNSPDPRFHFWMIDRDSTSLFARVQKRTQAMLEAGMIEEYQRIETQYPGCRALQAVGYAQIRNYLQGIQPPGRIIRSGLAGLSDEIQLATRQLIKSQRTWLKGQSKMIPKIKRFQLDDDLPALEEALKSVYDSE